MAADATSFAGIVIPSTDPAFLAVTIGLHIPLGIACVAAGAGAMLCTKRRGRHSTLGTIYFWCLAALFASAAFLSALRWHEDYHLFVLGALSLFSASVGRLALRGRWRHWVRLHMTGLGFSFVLMLIAFYVDNGPQLPVWKDLPHVTYWLVPLLVATPLLIRALLFHPLVHASRGR